MMLTYEDRNTLTRYAQSLQQHFAKWFYAPAQSKLADVMPSELNDIHESISQFIGTLQQGANADLDLSDEFVPLAKLSVEMARANIAERQEGLRESAVDFGVHKKIDELMKPIIDFQQSKWYQEGETLRLPSLTDFLTLEAAYQALNPYIGATPSKEFDSKFGILQSQRNFIPFLKYSRIEASLRNTDTTVAFADIDHFKTFNEQLTETVVDRDILRPVLRVIESHCYSRGFAFQFGGDEYVLLLPNMDKLFAEKFLFRLQEKLAELRFQVTESKIEISVGSCTFAADAFYTDQEILDLATKAKAFAKKKKNCIAIYNSNSHTEESLINISRNDLVLGAKAY